MSHQCDFCSVFFKSSRSLGFHLRHCSSRTFKKSLAVPVLQCPYCQFTTSDHASVLTKHLNKIHPGKSDQPISTTNVNNDSETNESKDGLQQEYLLHDHFETDDLYSLQLDQMTDDVNNKKGKQMDH